MSNLCWNAVLLALLVGTSGPLAAAKPPDLPADNDIRCREAAEQPEPWRWLPRFDLPTPRAHGAAPREDRPGNAIIAIGGGNTGFNPELTESARKARELFEAAQRLTRIGDFTQARARLREAHMANPICHYGQRAIQRLLEMESADASEESEPPLPPKPHSDDDGPSQAERSFRRVLESTQPLGLVRIPTY